jgi:CubicO group peptidase (beta-lactamase class C family)
VVTVHGGHGGKPPDGGSVAGVVDLAEHIDRVAAETGFAGVVRVDLEGTPRLTRAYGLADRAHSIPHRVDTRFGIASGGKGLTALTVMGLIEDGLLELSTPARSILEDDLPLIGGTTIEQLLGHTSGIGDHVDEDLDLDINEHVLPVPVHELALTEAYVPLLARLPPKFPPGERFSYCNAGYVVLALVAERVTGTPFHDLVDARVCRPAGMSSTSFLRADELPADAAVGYLSPDGLRTNVLHLPVRGTGDGGVYSTAADVHALWAALFEGRIVGLDRVEEMVRPRSTAAAEGMRYGLGFWLHLTGPAVILVGFDAGVSFRTVHDRDRRVTHTVLANTSTGAWPIGRHLDEVLAGPA